MEGRLGAPIGPSTDAPAAAWTPLPNNGAANPRCGDRRVEFEIPEADREYLTDTGGGAEERLPVLTGLLTRARAGRDLQPLPSFRIGLLSLPRTSRPGPNGTSQA